MARIAMLIGKDTSGKFVNPMTGEKLTCVAEGGEALNDLVTQYRALRSGNGIIKKGKTEIILSEVHMPATNTGGGMLKAKIRFKR